MAADYLTPRPRDYRRGVFKFISTGYGNRPRRQDLLRTVTNGITGTSMPSFRRLENRDLEAVVDYVLALTHRGELERMMAAHAASEEELNDEDVQSLAENILEQWQGAAEHELEPATKMPPFTPESVALGAEAFQKRDCFKCHGRDGRGGLAGGIDVGLDAWGHKDPAADLTSGMLHGGQTPADVYRRIYGGINGTPMPAFKDALASDPDTIWHLAHYVLHLANQRRHGVQVAQGSVTHASTDAAPGAVNKPGPPSHRPRRRQTSRLPPRRRRVAMSDASQKEREIQELRERLRRLETEVSHARQPNRRSSGKPKGFIPPTTPPPDSCWVPSRR